MAKKKTMKKKVVKKVKKVVKKSVKKKVAPKKKTTTSKRKPNAAFMRPFQPDSALAEVTGSKPLSRPEIVKKIWDYIKKNHLQDSVNRRMINCDGALQAIFGKDQVSMFEMNKFLGKHIDPV